MKNYFSSIPEALKEIQKGNPIIILDSERECEADFFLPAQLITPEHIMTMIRYGSGLLCVAITPEQAQKLHMPLMVPPQKNTEATKLNLTLSVNAKHGITTGISAKDRAKTIQIIANPASEADELTIPGHVFGVVAKPGGLLERTGHTEAAVDLSRLAGFTPAGVLCEIIRDDGNMAQIPDLYKLADTLKMPIVLLKDIISYVKQHPLPMLPQKHIVETAHATLPTLHGSFNISIYSSFVDSREHAALVMGDITKEPVLTRIHSQCFTGDTLGSLKCDCRDQLHDSIKKIVKHGSGILLYLNQEGRGIGLANKIKAYALQEQGLDTVEANHALGFATDERDYTIAADILHDLGIKKINLLTNNPDKIEQLQKNGIEIVERIPLEEKPNEYNKKYLETKKEKLGHLLENI